ncbi:dTDP-4-dehydrorhamnose 3,5-epimerase [Rhodanobacter sp. ANJX3]|uniref:dTDP-4-dehydrorhamnose 3,5-epimerase n=1 Tax=Rhodanobacter sp. ANJX3 TaxID=2723083 RepID=UPI001620720C|nr:dTDP-4-dehydrorhamnose 3,5-epimerase [Rhodanobacter sp. ANJX3]MBB5360684.1 dTDP-4-dehydrorhamnose 3,5-epimerase [Rhodanobacter sp. ANJX3]
MNFHATPLADLMVIETKPVSDERGQFSRVFCAAEYAALRPALHWMQINVSQTYKKGTVRGMHFQYPPAAEVKLIRCLRGRVFDVAVDLRADSPTFLRWHGVELDENEATEFLIPEGFAHGFQTLTDDAQLLYLHTAEWNREMEGGLRHDDPTLGIHWPLPVTRMSDKDQNFALVQQTGFAGLKV